MRSITLGDLAAHVKGDLNGPNDLLIHAAKIIRDVGPGEITFADRPRLAKQAEHCGASAVLTSSSFDPPKIPHIIVKDVATAFGLIVELFNPPSQHRFSGISVAAHISPTAQIGAGSTIGPGAVIGDHVVIGANSVIHGGAHIMAGSKVGDSTVIFPQVVLYEDTIVGDHVILHAGVVLGAYGFGYNTIDGRHTLTSQLGNVEVHDYVEIGANTTIDRGTYGPTVIGEGTKIDNMVMVGHNCRIGRHNLLCSQVGIAGSTTTGDYVVMAGQVGVRDHVTIGNAVQIGAQAGVAGDIEAGAHVVGTPARPERIAMSEVVALSRMPDMRKRVRVIERQLKAMADDGSDASDSNDGESGRSEGKPAECSANPESTSAA